MRFTELMSLLQVSVSPVILISGVGLLLLSMTNRLGRVVDRSRQLGDALRRAPEQDHLRLESQLDILFKRARLLRMAITFATVSVLLAAVLVISSFLFAFLRVEFILVSVILFIGCLLMLIGSLLAFLRDINLSLVALKTELGRESANV